MGIEAREREPKVEVVEEGLLGLVKPEAVFDGSFGRRGVSETRRRKSVLFIVSME